MDSSREAKRIRRSSILYGFGGAAVLMTMCRVVMPHSKPVRSMFGNPQHWPAFFQSFLPLDYLTAACYFGLLMFLMTKASSASNHPIKGTVQMILGGSVALGCFGGMALACMSGWILSFEGFLFFLVFGAAGMICLGGCFGIMLGASWCIARIWEMLWRRLRNTAPGRLLVRFGRYADGGPPDTPEA